MSVPSKGEVNDMKEILLRLQGLSADQPVSSKPSESFTTSVNEKQDMKNILSKFYEASGQATNSIIEDAKYDSTLREALITHKTPDGVVIGSWEVRAKLSESESGKKFYDVVNPDTSEVLFNNLVIFEAAHAIVRYLNKGLKPNHQKIEEIADLEEVFRRNRQDAAIFKKRYNRCIELKEAEAATVFNARYQKAKAQAIVANDQITTILQNIR